MTTVSGHHRVPSAISPVIRGRRTAHSGTSGTVILDVRIGSPAGPADRLVRPDPRLATWTAISTSRAPTLRRQRTRSSWPGSHAFGCQPGCHSRAAMGHRCPHNHPTSAGPRSHHAIGMKSSVCPAPTEIRGQKCQRRVQFGFGAVSGLWRGRAELIGPQTAHNAVTGRSPDPGSTALSARHHRWNETGYQLSRRPMSRARVTAWLREEAPSFR